MQPLNQRLRLPFYGVETSIALGLPRARWLPGFVFSQLHDHIKHDCIADRFELSRQQSIGLEWAYLPTSLALQISLLVEEMEYREQLVDMTGLVAAKSNLAKLRMHLRDDIRNTYGTDVPTDIRSFVF